MILVAIILQLNATSCGLGWTFDSTMYMQMSNDLMQNGFGSVFNNEKFSVKAPLFPLILSVYGSHFHLFYTLIFACSLILGSFLISEWVRQSWLRFIGISSLIFSTPLLMLHSYLWADSLMLFLFFLLLFTVNQYLKRQQLSLMIVLSIISALIIQIRFAGTFIVIPTMIFFIINYKKVSLKHIALYASITFIPFIIWLTLLPGVIDFRMNEYQSNQWNDLANNVFVMLHALSLYLFPLGLPSLLRIFPVVLFIIFIYVRNRRMDLFSFPFLCILIFVVYYSAFHYFFRIPISSSEKYIAPILPIFILVIFYTLDRLKYAKWNVLLISVCLVWLLYPLSRSIKNSNFWNDKICVENDEFNRPYNFPSVSID